MNKVWGLPTSKSGKASHEFKDMDISSLCKRHIPRVAKTPLICQKTEASFQAAACLKLLCIEKILHPTYLLVTWTLHPKHHISVDIPMDPFKGNLIAVCRLYGVLHTCQKQNYSKSTIVYHVL